MPTGNRTQYPITRSTAAALGCPAERVTYPATRTITAAARIIRFRRARRKRRGATDGRDTDIGDEATTVTGFGQVLIPLHLRAPLPIPRREPPGAADPGDAGVVRVPRAALP